ncbi:GEVED domain-containing protein, partial [Paenimyroides baculatum]
MKKITQLSRFKIRWLPYTTLILMFFSLFLSTMNGFAQTYCTPTYITGCSWDDDLNSFVITGHGTSVISDLNTGCNNATANAYSDKTTSFTPVDVMQSQTYPVQINTTYSSPTYELASIWIDFNDNGVFDASEKLLTDLPLAQSPSFVTASIAIPVTAPVGIHRMRVRVIYNTTGVDACTSSNYGETHDYKVNVLALPACSGTPTAGTTSVTTRTCNSQPFTLSATGSTVAGNMTYQWQSSPQGAGTWTNIPGANGFSHTVTTQTVATDYRFVVTCNTSNGTNNSNLVTVVQLAAVSTNFFEGFETTPIGGSGNQTVPLCWTLLNSTNHQWTYGAVNNFYPKTGNRNYYFNRYPLNQTDGQLILISPETVNLGNGTKQIRFSARLPWAGGVTPKLVVYTMNGTTNTATRTLVQSININSSTYVEYIVPLPPTTDDYFAISLEHNNPSDYLEIAIDDIYYEDMAACIFPLNLKVNNITTNSINISWDASLGTGVTGYEYEIRTSGAAGSGATGLAQTGIVSTPATTTNITGLNHSTVYTVYIRSKCGTSNGMWTPFPVKFNTLCDVVTNNFFEGFENTDVGSPWSTPPNHTVPLCWTYFDLNDNGYGYTSDYNQRTGNRGFYIYNSGNTVALVSPETNNLGAGAKRVRFWARMPYGSGAELGVYTLNGTTASATRTLMKKIALTTVWTEYTVYFPTTTTDDYFAFISEVGSGSVDINIDDIYYEDAPSCKPIEDSTIKVTNIGKNSFTVSWQDLYNANPMAYEVEVRTTGNPGTPGAVFNGTTAVGVTNLVATGLNPSTDYKVYVRSVCSATDQSIWSSAVAATTLCNYSDFVSYTPSLALCGPQKAELSAVLVDPTAMAAWYDAQNDAVPLFEGPDFISATDVTQDRSFWLRSRKTTPNTAVQLGVGTETNEYDAGQFLYHGWGGYKHQYIFTAAELNAAGLVAGSISALKFDVVTTGTTNRNDFSISLGTTTQSVATTNQKDNSTLTQVYSNPSETFAVGVKTFTFTTPYVWDGVSNVIVQTNWSNQNYGDSSGAVKYHTTSANMTTYTYADNRTAAELLATITGNVSGSGNTVTSSKRPNTIFVGVAGCVS